MVSMELRAFYKAFVIPRKLNKNKKNFVEENIHRNESQYNERYLKELDKDAKKNLNPNGYSNNKSDYKEVKRGNFHLGKKRVL